MGKVYRNECLYIKGGCKMKYEKPILEQIVLETEDLIRTSLVDGGEGDNDGQEGPWGN